MINPVVPIGVSHISLWPQETRPREREKKNKEQANNMGFAKLNCKKGGSVTLRSLCICRLTLACISSEISTKLLRMPTHLVWSSFTAPGLYLIPTGLFCCPVSTALLHHPSPTPFAGFLLPTGWLAFPCPIPVASRSRAQAFVWFCAKTNKKIVCLAQLLHSVTVEYAGCFSAEG